MIGFLSKTEPENKFDDVFLAELTEVLLEGNLTLELFFDAPLIKLENTAGSDQLTKGLIDLPHFEAG